MNKTGSPALGLEALRQLLLEASSAHSVEQQIDTLVAHIRALLDVDVCSLYQIDDKQYLHLAATEGLHASAPSRVVLSPGEGLAGLVARTQLPLNLANAAEHPNFSPIPDIGEEPLRAYLGLPIIYLGQTIGVLVLQDRKQRKFGEDEESFLIAITAQLAGGLARSTLRKYRGTANRKVSGLSGAPRKAIGRVSLCHDADTLQWLDPPEGLGVDAELARLDRCFEATLQEISTAQAQVTRVADDVSSIFHVYRQMLDEGLRPAARARVREGQSAFQSIRTTVDELLRGFEGLDDSYLRARGDDIRHLGHMLIRRLLDINHQTPPEGPIVLVGNLVGVTDIARVSTDRLAAIVSYRGAALSHAAVLAKALGIPAVVGTGLIDHIADGARIIVDGDAGEVIIDPDDILLDAYAAAIESERAMQDAWLAEKDLPAATLDGVSVSLLANTGLLADATPGLIYGAEGVGLYRSEFAFLSDISFPTEDAQFKTYRALLECYHPMPVTIRTLDIGGDKQPPYLRFDEDNPALGWRGIRFCIDNKAVIATQLRAMLRANEDLQNLQILIPMVSQLQEITFVDELLTEILDTLRTDHPGVVRPKLGVMIEVPGLIPLLPLIAPHVDFASIGTNDLTQYVLAVDRSNLRIARYYDPLHPGVLATIKSAVDKCNESGLPVSVCGEMAADPAAVVLLLGMGVPNLSMSAFAIPKIRAFVRCLNSADARAFVEPALRGQSAAAVREAVRARAAELGFEKFL